MVEAAAEEVAVVEAEVAVVEAVAEVVEAVAAVVAAAVAAAAAAVAAAVMGGTSAAARLRGHQRSPRRLASWRQLPKQAAVLSTVPVRPAVLLVTRTSLAMLRFKPRLRRLRLRRTDRLLPQARRPHLWDLPRCAARTTCSPSLVGSYKSEAEMTPGRRAELMRREPLCMQQRR
jgi:hypothetical protein